MARDHRSRVLGAQTVLVLLGACAAPAAHFGAGRADAPDRSFILSGSDQASTAVRRALLSDGYQERDDGKLRVEVGFAVRPTDLAVLTPGEGQENAVISPGAERSFSLCKRQAYVLTIAMVDRATGTIASRGGATISRCDGTPERILPGLVRTALSSRA